MKLKLFSLVCFSLSTILFTVPGSAQSPSELVSYKGFSADYQDTSGEKRITISMKDVPLRDILAEIDRQGGGLRLSYSPASIPLDRRVSLQVKNVSVREALSTALKDLNVRIEQGPEGQILLLSSPRADSVKGHRGSITGIVTDSSSGTGLPGVTVSVAGTDIVTTTRADGRYTLANVPPGKQTLVAKLLGYRNFSKVIETSADVEKVLDVSMAATAAALSEVVTTATGAQRRVEVPTDIVKIDADQIRERAPVRDVFDMIEAAQVPGILVTRESGDPGSGKRIRIRGIGSISQSNDPVMIVDGVWVDATAQRPSRIDDLDPASIEKVEIIRGPSAATLFGQDASNGVIVITTKKGQAGPTRWNISYNRDWGQTYGTQPLFYKGYGFSPIQADRVPCSLEGVLTYQCKQDTVIVYDPNNSLVSREGVETSNRVALQMDGGSQNLTYSVTLSTRNTTGVRRVMEADRIRFRHFDYQPESEFNRPSSLRNNSLTTAFVINPRENLSVGLTLTGTQSALRDNVLRSTWIGLRGGDFVPEFNPETVFEEYARGNIEESIKPVKTNSVVIASNIQYRPYGSFVINSNFGVEKTGKTESLYRRDRECSPSNGCIEVPGRRSEASDDRSVYTVRLNASTVLNLGGLNRFLDIRPSIGGDFKKTDQHYLSLAKDSIPVGDRGMNRGKLLSSTNMVLENAIAGWYLNSTVGLFQRVYFDVGIRQDIGSAITSSSNAVYPKIGGSWLVSDEGFWRTNSFLSSLRLRAALGHAAVQPEVADIHGQFLNGVEYIDGRFVNTVNLNGVGNSILRPERAVEVELGFDADMLNDRLNVVATYAHKQNRNTLVNRTPPPSIGASGSRKENVAKVRNRNVELSATGRAIETANTLLVLNYTLTLSDNRVMTLGDGVSPFGVSHQRIAAGYPIAGIWGRRLMGYFDEDGNGLISPDEIIATDSLIYIGWSQPRYRAGYGASLTLKNQIVIDSRFAYQSKYVPNYGLKPGRGAEDVNSPPAEQAVGMLHNLPGFATPMGGPVSDLRWSSASVTYHLPRTIIQKFGGRSISVSLQGSNLGLWTNYIGRDPGVNGTILDGEVGGDNGLTPPPPRTFVLDFKIGL